MLHLQSKPPTQTEVWAACFMLLSLLPRTCLRVLILAGCHFIASQIIFSVAYISGKYKLFCPK